MKRLIVIVCACAFWSLGCATPERIVSMTTWGTNGTTLTQSIDYETGAQLWLGARNNTQIAKGNMISSGIDKAELGAFGKMLVGAAVGAYLGGLPGAVLGGAGGAATSLIPDKTTTSTNTMLVPVPGGVAVGGATTGRQSALAGLLADYVAAHPESCGLAQRLGGPAAAAAIRQLGGQPGATGALWPILTEVLKAKAGRK